MTNISTDLLKESGLAQGLSEQRLEQLVATLPLESKTFNPGETLFEAGDVAGFLYLVESGNISVRAANGSTHPMSRNKAVITGEQGVIDPQGSRLMTLQADSVVTAYSLRESDLSGLDAEIGRVIWRNIAWILAEKLRHCRTKGRAKEGSSK